MKIWFEPTCPAEVLTKAGVFLRVLLRFWAVWLTYIIS